MCTSDGKITLQSMTRAIELWNNQKNGVVTSQVMLLNEQSRLLSRGFSSAEGVVSKETEVDTFNESPVEVGMTRYCLIFVAVFNHLMQVCAAA